MNLEHISKVVGREITAENVGTLTAEDWTKINQSLSNPASGAVAAPEGSTSATSAAPVVETAAAAENNAQTTSPSAELTAAIANAVDAAVAQHVAPLVERVQNLENRTPSAPVTPTPAVTGADQYQNPWENPNDPLNQEVDKFFKGE